MRLLVSFAVMIPLAAAAQAAEGDCRRDSDCTMSSFAGCCGSCCPAPSEAVSVKTLEAQRHRCAAVDCARPRCEAVKCAPLDPADEAEKRAVCRGGQCVTQAPPPPAPEPDCRVDSDCAMTTFACCGGCCPAPSRAVGVKQLKREQDVCAITSCAARNCAAVKCLQRDESPEQIAVCRAGVCIAETARAECRADGDCELVPAPTGGCCSAQWQARPLERPHLMDDAPPPARGAAKQDDPRFGLSAGSSGGGCGACPALPPARAACRAARCVVQPMKR